MMLEVQALRVMRGGHTVIDLPHFAVREGEVLAVAGPNGSGKSSLLLALALLLPAQFRRYSFGGRPASLPADNLSLRRQMALVLQEALLLDTTVLENAASGLRLRGMPKQQARDKAAHWLERLGVGHLASRSSYQLSGGEAQRVSLARALAMEPRLLLLDEPFAPLDVLTKGRLLKDLRRMLAETGSTAILVTHDVTEVAHLADRLAVLEAGQLVQEGTPREVFSAPGSELVRQMALLAADTTAALSPIIGKERVG